MLATPALAGGLDCLPESGRVVAARAVDGVTVRAEDDSLLRLAEIGVPEPPIGRDMTGGLPRAAEEALDRLVHGRTLVLRGDVVRDRYGRAVADATRDDGVWLEAALVEQGLAWVATTPEQHAHAAALLALETKARQAAKGLWRSTVYGVRQAQSILHTDDRFAIVEGTTTDADAHGGTTTIGFSGATLTLRLDRTARRRFRDAGLGPDDLANLHLRVRGWPYWAGHPQIDLTHPEQVEFPDKPAPAAAPSCP